MNIIFNEQEDDCWTCTSFKIKNKRKDIRLTLTSRTKPDEIYINKSLNKLSQIDNLILKASKKILENYSYEHYKNLNVPEEKLEKVETAEAISKRASLEEVWFCSSECDEFELSFTVPWDDYHSYDVEFEENEPVCCSVNG